MLFAGFQLLLGEELNKPEKHASGTICQKTPQIRTPAATSTHEGFLHILPEGILVDERWVGRAEN